MKITLDTRELEIRGFYNKDLLSKDQQNEIETCLSEVSAQLDWLGQLLGWLGPDYWDRLDLSIEEKRRLLAGTYGMYGFLTPLKVFEFRNWDYSIITQSDDRIKENQTLRCGKETSTIERISKQGDKIKITFRGNQEGMLREFETSGQIYAETPELCYSPFNNPEVKNEADFSFTCKEKEGSLLLFVKGDDYNELPILGNMGVIRGSLLTFDLPVSLITKDSETIISRPFYRQEEDIWDLRIPQETPTSAILRSEIGGSTSEIMAVDWKDPSDWLSPEKTEKYLGVWGNKGGELPLAFMFDSLNIRGFSKDNSIVVEDWIGRVPFNSLMNSVYLGQISVDRPYQKGSVWWDSRTGDIMVWDEKNNHCFPWVQYELKGSPFNNNAPTIVFPSEYEFLGGSETLPPDTIVQINDISSLTQLSKIRGIPGNLTGVGDILIAKDISEDFWNVLEMSYPDVYEFIKDSDKLPIGAKIKIINANGMLPGGGSPDIVNLDVEINRDIEVILVKESSLDKWILYPPNPYKFVGETRLFPGGGEGLQGEVIQSGDRYSIYYFNRWEEEGGEWVLKGDWVDLTSGENLDPPSTDVHFSAIAIYCNGQKMEMGSILEEKSFSMEYGIDFDTGEVIFNFSPSDTEGMCNLPKIEVSDIITSSSRADITNLVFSGRAIKVRPSPLESETLLRPYTQKPLLVCGDTSLLDSNPEANFLRAGNNLGVASNLDRISIRLPLNYRRGSREWNRANMICQSFSPGGSTSDLVKVKPPSMLIDVPLYDELVLRSRQFGGISPVFHQPWLFSGIDTKRGFYNSPWSNSALLPNSPTTEGSNWGPSYIESYEPLNNRKTDEYGNWLGSYGKISSCSKLEGFFNKDVNEGSIKELPAPIWDSSIYKIPPMVNSSPNWDTDPNDFRVEYGMFIAGQSVAGDAVYSLQGKRNHNN
jgi:hypothetical protein